MDCLGVFGEVSGVFCEGECGCECGHGWFLGVCVGPLTVVVSGALAGVGVIGCLL